MVNTISTKKYTSADFYLYTSLVNNDKVMKYISGSALNPNQAQVKFESILAVNAKEEKLGYFKVYNNAEEFIGDCKLERYTEDPNKLEIGYILKEAYWGQGYGTTLCNSMMEIANNHFPELDVIGIIDPQNTASRKLLKKNGFVSFFIGIEDNLPTEKLILKRQRN